MSGNVEAAGLGGHLDKGAEVMAASRMVAQTCMPFSATIWPKPELIPL
ncbi:hypothetical protein ACFCW4_20955 [Streptomyces virginiae]